MTADVELLPCPFCGGEAHLERQGHVCCKTRFCRGAGAFDNYGTAKEQNASAVARWNTRATAAKDDEIEALRAEVKRLTGCLATANANHEMFERRWYLEQDRAERLAEALREALREIEQHAWTRGNGDLLQFVRSALNPTAAQGDEAASA